MSIRPSWKTTPAATSMTRGGVAAEDAGSPLPMVLSVIRHTSTSSTYALVDPALPFHFPGVEEVSTIEQDGMGHHLAGALEVQLLELRPFRGDDQRVAAVSHGVHVGHIRCIFQFRFRLLH